MALTGVKGPTHTIMYDGENFEQYDENLNTAQWVCARVCVLNLLSSPSPSLSLPSLSLTHSLSRSPSHTHTHPHTHTSHTHTD